MNKTYIPKVGEIDRKCFLIDAEGQILGRLAVKVATLLTGKDEPMYVPHMECGDQVIVINARKIRVTGRKLKDKTYDHYTGYPGGRTEITFEMMQQKKPEFIITEAVRKMLPKNRLRPKMLKRLHVYADATHRQAAQQPVTLSLSSS